jgi:diguanylate cyclase (GGDEF)-like protein
MSSTRAAGLLLALAALHPPGSSAADAGASAVSPRPAASAATSDPEAAFDREIDELARTGFDWPAPAIEALRRLQQQHAARPDRERRLLLALGSVAAQTGDAAAAGRYAEQLLALPGTDPSGRRLASSNLIRAQVAENTDQLDVAAALAQSVLPVFEAGCDEARSAPPAGTAPACEYRAAWRALQLLERRALSRGLTAAATTHALAGLALAETTRDAPRQMVNLTSLATFAQTDGDTAAANRWLERARQIGQPGNDPAQRARLANGEARVAAMRGELKAMQEALNEALPLSILAHEPRLQAQLLNNLSDCYVRTGRPADALAAVERALPIVRQYHDLRLERVLLSNAGIAKIGLHRIDEAKQDLARLLELWAQGGETGREAQTLQEFGEALSAAGDGRGALDLYHRERSISADIMQANRKAALKELQDRHAAQARERDIELLARDNALKTEALANRELLQRIWWLVAAVMGLLIVLASLLVRRVRETQRRLAASQVQLQAQSERDPLTDLANRRHFHAVMTRLCGDGGYDGALLLIDIDHFKHINDEHGHGAGDAVLVEVARRLQESVREDDLVVRWGGEEFLILSPRAGAEQAEQMAARVLNALAERPFPTAAPDLRVTASIGYARFPLPPHAVEVPWEQAVNLADMALYTAKSQGRNQAVGIRATTAPNRPALAGVEADFDAARREGRVTLLHTHGPQPLEPLRVA